MKRYSSIMIIVFAALALGACSDDKDFVEIDSLHVFGEEFSRGYDKVHLGISVRTNDPQNARYEWFCEAGTLRASQQGFPTMTWRAPAESGEYTVGCTVTSGNAKQTRIVKVKVSGLFFERFSGRTVTGWTKSSNTPSMDIFEGHLAANVNPTANGLSDSLGHVLKAITGKSDFAPPVAATAMSGIVGGVQNQNDPKFPIAAPLYAYKTVTPGIPPEPDVETWSVGNRLPGDEVEIRQPVMWENFLGLGLTGSTPDVTIAPDYHISEVRIDWWPVETHMHNSLAYYSTSDNPAALTPPSTVNATDFNARVAIRWVLRQSLNPPRQESSGWVMIPFKSDKFSHATDVDKIVGIAITADYTINVMVDKEVVYTTDGLKTWRNNWAPGTPFIINQIKYVYPKWTRIYLDDVVVTDSAEFAY